MTPVAPADAAREDGAFVERVVAVAAPVLASAVVAPSPLTWAAVWAAALVAVGVRREARIRRRAARPMTPAVGTNAQVIPLPDSRDDSTDDSTRQKVRAA